MKAKQLSLTLILSLLTSFPTWAKNGYDLLEDYILKSPEDGTFSIVSDSQKADIIVDGNDWPGVIRAAEDLAADIFRVTGYKPNVIKVDSEGWSDKADNVVVNNTVVADIAPDFDTSNISQWITNRGNIIVGSIGKSRLIDELVGKEKLDVRDTQGQWESFTIETVDGNLVVAGSDKRGSIYGIYDISEKIGISPWYFWADVPVRKSDNLYVKAGRYHMPSPKVKYRGIFINDEWPSFGGWCQQKFGGVNSKMYATMFELLLRLKANYLWPAMWASAFNEDDPMSPQVADEYGIVMGTSHHEPMMRAHKEYTSRRNEVGPWDYASNPERIEKFFREGIERNKEYENIITIGMRGDGDVAMGSGDDRQNIETLKDVVRAQRKIISQAYGCPPEEVPQLWAIFTEVQRYYDAGLTVPEDVTLLFCDNNWGFIRRTGPKKEQGRKGGLGMYFHIDMNGGPANDRWVNTTTPAKIREQLNLAYQTGIDRIWIINVGDLKPKEMPIDFIMRYAWDPEAICPNDTQAYLQKWAQEIFGEEHAVEIADIVQTYSNLNLMRKAEVQNPNTFSVINYDEADRVLQMWDDVANRAQVLEHKIPQEARDAYYQLVYYPTVASAGVARIYIEAARNNLYAKQGRISANRYAENMGILFEDDKRLSDYYNQVLSQGKWRNMMSDNHIGYVEWFIPEANTLPHTQRVEPLPTPTMGLAVSGLEVGHEALPMFDVLGDQRYFIDVFNKGLGEFAFEATVSEPWIQLSNTKGKVIGDKDQRIEVSIDWTALPLGKTTGKIFITSDTDNPTETDNLKSASIEVVAFNYPLPQRDTPYFGGMGEISIPSTLYTSNIEGKYATWIPVADLGRGEGCMLSSNVTAPSAKIKTGDKTVDPTTKQAKEMASLEYDLYLPQDGELIIALGILPTQDIDPARGLRIGLSVDEGPIEILDARKSMTNIFNEYTAENLALSPQLKPLPKIDRELSLRGNWKNRRNDIFDNIRWIDTSLGQVQSGLHKIKVFMVDPEIVLERIIVNPDNSRYTYLGAATNRIMPATDKDN